MDTRFAKIVTDLFGKDHLLIEGRLITVAGDQNETNPIVDAIARALRGPSEDSEHLITRASAKGPALANSSVP